MTLEQLNESFKYGGLGGYTIDEQLKTYLPDVYQTVIELEEEKFELEDSIQEYDKDLSREQYKLDKLERSTDKAKDLIDRLVDSLKNAKQVEKDDVIDALLLIKQSLES